MHILSSEDMQALVYGAAFLGSGGGGSLNSSQALSDYMLKTFGEISIYDVSEIGGSETGAVFGAIGSPDALAANPSSITPAVNKAIQLLQQTVQENYGFVLSVETGVNMFIAMIAAYSNNLKVVDGDGAGRAVPDLGMLTYAASVAISPTVLTNTTTYSMALYAPKAEDMDNLIRPIISTPSFGAMGGLGLWNMNGSTMQNVIIPHTFTNAIELGYIISQNQHNPSGLLQELHNYFGQRMLWMEIGTLTSGTEITSGGFDRGVTTFQTQTQLLTIVNQNENLIVWSNQSQAPIALAPNLICFITKDGIPYTNTDNLKDKIGTEFYICYIKALPQLQTSYALQKFQENLEALGYYGAYAN
jgi:uncharacterized protein